MIPKGFVSHVVIIVKENHTFDNYFGSFPGADGDSTLGRATDPPPSDPPHDHRAWLNRATGAVRKQYTQADIPAYFDYARRFTLCDSYFTEVASQSIPNHLMLVAADSPLMDNPHKGDPPQLQPPFSLPSLPAGLRKAGLDWGSYGGDFVFRNISGLMGQGRTKGSAQFSVDAASGNLPAVSWLYSENLSEHPPHGAAAGPVVRPGMEWTVQQVNAIVQGGLWKNTVIFITWDDWGGWYDHVEPRNVEQWPANGWPASYQNTQFRYGPRVGCLVLSPYAKQGYISKVFHSHVSLVKFCESAFGLPALNARDSQADDMSDCFDFTQSPAPPPVTRGGGGSPGPRPPRPPSPRPPKKPAKPVRRKPKKPVRRRKRRPTRSKAAKKRYRSARRKG